MLYKCFVFAWFWRLKSIPALWGLELCLVNHVNATRNIEWVSEANDFQILMFKHSFNSQ